MIGEIGSSTIMSRTGSRYGAQSLLTLLAIAMLAGTNLAHAAPAAAAPAWAGVWRGTVGTAAVRVCLQHDDYQDIGAYYYLRHLTIISLGKLGEQPVWTEAPNSDRAAKGPLWRLTTITNTHLQGSWSAGTQTLPITLDRVALAKADAEDSGTTCGNPAFSLPRFTKPILVRKPATLNGIIYTRILVDPGRQFEQSGTETFQLRGTTPAMRRVNAALYATVPTGPENATYFTCSMAALGQNGLDGDDSSTLKPLILMKNWMVSEDDEENDCGGAHPNSDVRYATWDLRSGAQINLYDWFTTAALTQTINDRGSKNAYVTVAFRPAFKHLIDVAYSRDDPECRDTLAEADAWDPRLTEAGIAFTPELPHVAQACEEDALVSFAQLTPFLNTTGRAQIAAFRKELSPSRRK
ncbi:hypothetical protein GCM10008023_36310 [Sphingomonas glacialis]|uniref:Secreted protein n=1 Tax=Sphingomonas glacialis TaxID=658225 RepID=A0ABQ3LSU1_9SPHN|nr:hypothetical protein [Sphingomonas glacialis]GHH24294.1 hypothetical protein GCM10008023_36310 [Sphingomonas glacialis]